MDSSRFWNTVRSLEGLAAARATCGTAGTIAASTRARALRYVRAATARGPTIRAKLERFVARAGLAAATPDVLFVLDRVAQHAIPSFRKAWLLHGVCEPKVEGGPAGTRRRPAAARLYADARSSRSRTGKAGCASTRVLPLERERHRRAAARAGSSGRRATSTAAPGAPGRTGRSIRPRAAAARRPYLKKMWLTFWGGDMSKLSPSNRRAVVPGRLAASRSRRRPAATDDVFLQRPRDRRPRRDAAAHRSASRRRTGLAGAVVAGEAAVAARDRAAPAGRRRGHAARTSPRARSCSSRPRAARDLRRCSSRRASPRRRRCGGASAEANDAGVLEHRRGTRKDGRLRVRRRTARRELDERANCSWP